MDRDRDTVGVGVLDSVARHSKLIEPTLHLFFSVLPSVVWVVPVKVNHVVCCEVEGIIPKTLQEIVVQEPLYFVTPRWNT